MKSTLRAISLIVFLFAVASPLFAQNPKIAIRYDIDRDCVKGTLANITTATILVKYVELWIYDQKTCKRICVSRKVINTKIKRCDRLGFDLCCDNLPRADGYIYYVRVTHSGGVNEQWHIT
jgi:hypothetical protein